VDEYRERYHGYLQQIVEGYFESGLFERTVNELDAKINDYVRNDVNTFYNYDQYTASLPVFIELGQLRAESIRGQLEGTIPSTTSGQNADSSTLVDASGINLSTLGSMMGGGGMGGGGMNQGGWPGGGRGDAQDENLGMPGGGFGMFGDDSLDMGLIMQAMQILMEADWEMTDDVKVAILDLGLTDEQIEMLAGMQTGITNGLGRVDRLPNGNDNMPGGEAPRISTNNTIPGSTSSEMTTIYVIAITISLALLAGAIIFVAKPRKHTI